MKRYWVNYRRGRFCETELLETENLDAEMEKINRKAKKHGYTVEIIEVKKTLAK